MEIEPLIARVLAGDRAAFAAIVRHYQGPLFGFLGRMGLDGHQSQDVAQDCFVRAWRHLDQFDARQAGFATWLFTIARNLAFTELTRPAHRNEVPYGDDAPQAWVPGNTPPDIVAQRQQRLQLERAIRQLPTRDRSILALAYVQGLDLQSVARIEGMTPGALKTRLHRARRQLRELLEPDHDA